MTSLTCLQHEWPYLAFTRIVGTNSDFNHTPFTAATKLFHVKKKSRSKRSTFVQSNPYSVLNRLGNLRGP